MVVTVIFYTDITLPFEAHAAHKRKIKRDQFRAFKKYLKWFIKDGKPFTYDEEQIDDYEIRGTFETM